MGKILPSNAYPAGIKAANNGCFISGRAHGAAIPSGDIVHIAYKGNAKDNVLLTVHNAQGQLVLRKSSAKAQEELDVSQLAKGIYFLEVIDGDRREVKKIIVQ